MTRLVSDRGPVGRAARFAAATLTAAGTLSTAHLLVLLAGAGRGRGRGPRAPSSLRFAVVIPAHDEEHQIGTTLDSITSGLRPPQLRRTIVVADNCSDATGHVARARGAEVWERQDQDRRGKGYALAWAFDRVLADPEIDAICVIDADCQVSANLLTALGRRLQDGADAAQATYLLNDPETGTGAALRWAGFALFNAVRPRGRDALGLSSGLLGTGMAFTRRLLERSPWSAFSYAEDREQHMRWVLEGARVGFAPEAVVSSAAAAGPVASRAQEARWESGRAGLLRSLSVRLVVRAVSHRDPVALDAALEPLLPPQSLLATLNLGAIASTGLTPSPRVRRLAWASAAGQVLYVAGGLASTSAPPAVWRALLASPGFIARRIGLLGALAVRGGPGEWERTPRRPETGRAREPSMID
jgi:1,2-diacylglycerol 3-beta-glucosyltransferase